VTVKRLDRKQFFDKLAEMDEEGLKKSLWTIYWRGTASTRERIEAAIDPQVEAVRRAAAKTLPDPDVVLWEVKEFVSLARAGSYLAGDRRVSPRERTRWRHTFRRLAGESLDALGAQNAESAMAAMAALIDLACEMRDYDYFRSEDPVEAARFVVSDAAAALWSRSRQEYGLAGFAERAAGQLLRWESRYGWTRRGDGWVSTRETTLAHVVAGLLPVPDVWGEFADHYLRALDRTAEGGHAARRRRGQTGQARAEALSEWHGLLLERLVGSDYEDRLDALVEHPALAGPERTFLQARLEDGRGDRDRARVLVRTCLTSRPGHRDFLAFAEEVGASTPEQAKRPVRAGAAL
jgi:hypothetical protein